MPKFKVVNPDAPEEIDFYQDIPLVDPDTGADQLDSEGNILVKRYVNHTVSLKGINEVKNALPAIKTNTRNLEELYQYSHAQNEAQQVTINENSSAIVDLQTSASEMALDLDTLKNKINGIQGIDIDDLKDYVHTQVPLIKNSYLPLVGGTITGNLTIEEGTITGSLTGTASNATADVNNKKLTSYVADIMGANAQLSIIKGDGTTSVISINNVLTATKATQDKNGAQIDTTYFKSANGTFTGDDYYRDVNNSVLRFNGGNTRDGGASLMLYGKNAEIAQGVFDLVACTKEDASDAKQLIGTPAGSLTWNGHEVERVELKNGNYIRFASGLTLMWGMLEIPGGTKKYTVNLPIPFKSDYQVFLSNLIGIDQSYYENSSYGVTRISSSAFAIQHTFDVMTGWAYFAVGY